jgi:hypothetical protein
MRNDEKAMAKTRLRYLARSPMSMRRAKLYIGWIVNRLLDGIELLAD